MWYQLSSSNWKQLAAQIIYKEKLKITLDLAGGGPYNNHNNEIVWR